MNALAQKWLTEMAINKLHGQHHGLNNILIEMHLSVTCGGRLCRCDVKDHLNCQMPFYNIFFINEQLEKKNALFQINHIAWPSS